MAPPAIVGFEPLEVDRFLAPPWPPATGDDECRSLARFRLLLLGYVALVG